MENKIYTEKRVNYDKLHSKLPILHVNYDKLHSKLPIFRVKSVKIYTGQKKIYAGAARDKYEVWDSCRLIDGETLDQRRFNIKAQIRKVHQIH